MANRGVRVPEARGRGWATVPCAGRGFTSARAASVQDEGGLGIQGRGGNGDSGRYFQMRREAASREGVRRMPRIKEHFCIDKEGNVCVCLFP